jgi:hypothetical protein
MSLLPKPTSYVHVFVCPHCRQVMEARGPGSKPNWYCWYCGLLIERRHLADSMHYISDDLLWWLPEDGRAERLISAAKHPPKIVSYRVDWESYPASSVGCDEGEGCPIHGEDCPYLPATVAAERERE